MTKMCVALDWTGGEFFPTIFCDVALGYAVASLMGADPLLPVAVASGAAVGSWTRKQQEEPQSRNEPEAGQREESQHTVTAGFVPADSEFSARLRISA